MRTCQSRWSEPTQCWDKSQAYGVCILNQQSSSFAMTRDCPAGFHSVKAEQLIKADRELWTILAQENLESLKPANDVPVLNKFFKALVTDPRIIMYLLPVPSAVQKVASTSTPAPKVSPAPKPQGAPSAGINKWRKLTRAQKGCPHELKDFDMMFNQGGTTGPICWGYNLKIGCPLDTSTQGGHSRCKRGFHVCANCHKPGHNVVTFEPSKRLERNALCPHLSEFAELSLP